jgi:integrase
MATIVKQRGKWRVQIRRAGVSLSRTFTHKKDASLWAKMTEVELELMERRGEESPGLTAKPERQAPSPKAKGITLRELITRYRDTVTINKKGKKQETHCLNAFLRHQICALAMSDVKRGDFAAYRDQRLKTVKPITLKRELSIIRTAIEVARDEWDVAIPTNPLDKLRLKAQATARDRRLQDGELERIVEGAKSYPNPLVLPVILFAIETGMRRGEIFRMRWEHLDAATRCLTIPETKNGYVREIPLTDKTWTILEALGARASGPVFQVKVNCFRIAWTRLKTRLVD